jgi:hypothetical protein
MSFFDGPIESHRANRPDWARQRNTAHRLVELFAHTFPQLNFSLVWESPHINAQAWRLGAARNVYLYGGLVRHPAITRAGLAFALAHETGHHLGGEPRDPDMTWMTWQGQADYWAAQTGMPAVFGSVAKQLTVRGALQIRNLERQLSSESNGWLSDLSPRTRLRIIHAALRGEQMPACARDELAKLQSPS